MAPQKEPDKENAIVIRDRRKPNQYTTDNVIAREWLPILRVGDAFFFYSVYLSMANRETESSWGSLRTMAQYLQCGIDLITRGNKLLEICELIHIEPGNQYTSNEYYILDPPPLTRELAARITARLDELEAQESGKNWQAWVKQVRKALDRHSSLPDIWARRRANRGGRPTKRETNSPAGVEPVEKGDRESQSGKEEMEKGDRESQSGCMCDTHRVIVSHNQGDRDSHAEQEQLTRQTNKIELRDGVFPGSVLVLEKCRALGVSATVIEVLFEQYPLDRLERQLAWLPARNPRDPAALFVRAVQEDWTQPAQYDSQKADRVWKKWLKSVGGDTGPGDDDEAVETETGEQETQRAGGQEQDTNMMGAGMDERPIVVPGTDLDVRQMWGRTLRELEMQMTRVTFDTWLRGSQAVGVRENGIVVRVRDGYAVEWLQARLSVAIRRTLAGIAGQPVEVYFEVA